MPGTIPEPDYAPDSLFGGPPTAGDQARDEAVKKVDEHADDYYKACAWASLERHARVNLEFISDEARVRMEAEYPDAETHDARVWGPLMKRAQSEGIVEPTDRFEKTPRASNHSAPKRVWRSLIYRHA